MLSHAGAGVDEVASEAQLVAGRDFDEQEAHRRLDQRQRLLLAGQRLRDNAAGVGQRKGNRSKFELCSNWNCLTVYACVNPCNTQTAKKEPRVPPPLFKFGEMSQFLHGVLSQEKNSLFWLCKHSATLLMFLCRML